MKKFLSTVLALSLSVSMLAACGGNKTASNTEDAAEETTQQFSATKAPDATSVPADSVSSEFKIAKDNITENEDGSVSVAVETRDGDEAYSFEEDDLGFVDTTTGALIKIGMSVDTVEELIGQPQRVDSSEARVYSGIVVLYDENMNVNQLIVATGNMNEDDNPQKFVTPRGAYIGMTMDDYISVYGDEISTPDLSDTDDSEAITSSATAAIRYYARSGSDFTYLGQSYTKDQKPENDDDLIMMTTLFSTETGNVSVISIKSGTDIN